MSPFTAAVTVTVFAPPFSVTVSGLAVSVIPGSSSSSVIVIVSFVTVTSEVPVTSSVSLPSCSTSFVGVRVKEPVPLSAPIPTVIVNAVTAV